MRTPLRPKLRKPAPWLLAFSALATTQAGAAEQGFGVRGYIHYDVRDFSQTIDDSPGETSELRRVRPIFEYRGSGWSARFMPDLARETNQALDAYVDFTPDGNWDLRIGRFKSPLSIDRLRSSNAIALMENSVVAAMTPNRDNGVLFGIETEGESHWRFEAGVFDGAADDEVKGPTDASAEWTLRTLRTQALRIGTLRFGVAASGGNREGDAADPRLARYRTPGRSTWFRYGGGAFADGRSGRIGAFADYHGGPWHAQLEAMQSSETVRTAALRERFDHRGWELPAGRVLTGEDRTARGVTPGNLRVPGLDLPVAVELTARVGQLRIDRDAFDGFADPTRSGERLDTWGVALGLWFPKQWRLTLDYERSDIRTPAAGTLREEVLMARAAIAF